MISISPLASLPTQRVIVGVGEISVSNSPAVVLSTYGLGSCVAVIAFDPETHAGGMLHLMLPVSRVSPEKAVFQPAMFADTGLPELFRGLQALNCDPARFRIFVAGGATVLCTNDAFKIGQRNVEATTAFLAAKGHTIHHSAVGGALNRTIHFHLGTGAITIKTPTSNSILQITS